MVPGLEVGTHTGKVAEAAGQPKGPRQVCAEPRTWTSPDQRQEWVGLGTEIWTVNKLREGVGSSTEGESGSFCARSSFLAPHVDPQAKQPGWVEPGVGLPGPARGRGSLGHTN